MLVFVIRLLFFLAMVAGGYVFGGAVAEGRQLLGMLGFAGAAILVIALDLALRRKNISVVSAVFFGLLVGLVVAMLLGMLASLSGRRADGEAGRAAPSARMQVSL